MADLNNIGEQPELFKLFVGQIPKDMDELNLRPYFEEFGHIVEISIIRDNITMMSKGCAFVTFSYEHAAQMAVDKLHDKVQLPNAINPLQVRFAETQVDRDNKLFIGMLPKTMVEQDLHEMFGIFGEIREVHVIRGPEGGAKGCAFVKFIEREAALAAIDSLNDTIPPNGTRPLVVKFADGKKPKEDPWSMYRHGGTLHPMGHPQSRMMYPYGQQPLGMPHQGPAGGYAPYGGGGAPRYGYSQPGHSTGYYPGQDGQDNKRSPVYGQDGLLGKSGAEGEFGGRGEAYDSGLDALPPNSGGSLPGPPAHGSPPFPVDSESSHVRPPEGPSGANLFIYHLPRDLTDADLATLFAPFGNVISAKVFVDKKTSDSKGFGFVSYDTLENANAAIEAMNGFQIGSKRLKVQHKRVAGGPHTAGMSHSPYGAMMHGSPPPHMHLGHPGGVGAPYQQQHQQQHAQPPAYSYRPSPMPLTTPPGVMMGSSALMQQPPTYGGPQTGLSGGGYPPQMRSAGPPAVTMPVQNRMQAQAGRSGYSYPSYSASMPTYAPVGTPQGQQPQQQQQQRPNMMLPTRPDSGYGGGLASGVYSAPDVPQPHSPLGQPQQLGGPMSYMDGSGPKTLQSQAGGGNGYYGQY